MAEEKTI